MKYFYLTIIVMVLGQDISYAQKDTLFTPSQNSSFSGSVRGYWFKAPFDFSITKLYIPTDASSGNQSIAVMKMNEIRYFPSSTNNFTLLYLVQDTSEMGWIEVNIPVLQNDTIGILGSRGNTNSYTTNTTPIVSLGDSMVSLNRLGMQAELRNTVPSNLFGSTTKQEISRIFFEFIQSSCPNFNNVSVSNASSPSTSDGSISLDLSKDNNSIRYLRWATKNGVNYPSTNEEDVTGLAPGSYYLFVVTRENEPCYLGPITVGP